MTCLSLSRVSIGFTSALSLMVAAGCGTSFEWREWDLGPVAFQDAWTGFAEIAAVDGFPMDTAVSDRGHRTFVSRWRTRAMPFRRSNRRRVIAEFERGTTEGSWRVRYYVEQQKVSDIGRTFSPVDEDWGEDGQDGQMERRFAAKLRMRFGTGVESASGPR